jgi:photosystem II stability/assembly factor-like uncharacterized protein
LFFFDEEQGRWIEEGGASIVDGKYVGTVTHFSSWNADVLYIDEICEITGRTVDQFGNPLPYCAVDIWGVDYTNLAYVASDAAGEFKAQVRTNSIIKVEAVYSAEFFYRSDIYTFNTCDRGGVNHIGDIEIDTSIFDRINYEVQDGDINQALFGVHFLDEQNGWVVGSDSRILNTTNGGETWNIQNTPGVYDLRDIHMISNQIGWAVGGNGIVMKTINGGTNWLIQDIGNYGLMNDILFIDNMTGWITTYNEDGASTIIKSTDGGETWSEGIVQTSEYVEFRKLDFVDASLGWAIDRWNGYLGKTTDGGATWEIMDIGAAGDHSISLQSLHMQDANNIWVVGWKSDWEIIYHSEDGAATWEVNTQESFNYESGSSGLHFVQAFTEKIWTGGRGGTVASSNDNGLTWGVIELSDYPTMYDAHFVHANLGWAVGFDARADKAFIVKLTSE